MARRPILLSALATRHPWVYLIDHVAVSNELHALRTAARFELVDLVVMRRSELLSEFQKSHFYWY
jgi:hypothetical protein